MGSGNQTSALASGGEDSTPALTTATEEWSLSSILTKTVSAN